MTSLEKLIPDLLNLKETRICWQGDAPPGDQFNASGVRAEKKLCELIYNDRTPAQYNKKWKDTGEKYIDHSGGWRNAETIWNNFLCGLISPDVKFEEYTVGDVKKAIETGVSKPIYFDYMDAWKNMVKAIEEKEKRKISNEEFEKMPIGYLVKQGAPPYWRLRVQGVKKPIDQSTSTPFDASQSAFGFFVSEIGEDWTTTNATGARDFDTKAINHLLVYLRHPENIAIRNYVDEALWAASMQLAEGKEVPFNVSRVDDFAEGFYELAGPVKDEVVEIVKKYSSDIAGIQHASRTHTFEGLPAGLNKYGKQIPHAFVKTIDDGWQRAEL